jgi:hypothetical protein
MADEGFFSRWSRRKAEARDDKELEQGPQPSPQPSPAGGRGSEEVSSQPVQAQVPEQPPPPTLEDVQSLSFESDFKRFVAPDVDPQVKTAAVKKLFADPRFNVRDPMDVYADDYTKPDPIPESMMRKLATAQVLGLFRDDADDVKPQSVAEYDANADTHLRLQQDDAAGPESDRDRAGGTAAPADDAVPPGSGDLPESDPR